MNEIRIGQKKNWIKSFGPKPVGRKLGARFTQHLIFVKRESSFFLRESRKTSHLLNIIL